MSSLVITRRSSPNLITIFSMSFNHYAKMKRILENQSPGWYIQRIDKQTKAKSFSGVTKTFDYYYRIYSKDGEPIKYCKFQQIERLSKILGVSTEKLPIRTGEVK